MSTTRSQKRRNSQHKIVENVSEGFVSPVIAENSCSLDQDVDVVGPSKPKSPRVENSALESLRVSLNEEITSEIKHLLMESQREMLKLLRSETGENVRNSTIDETENETSFHTPTKTVRINSTSNHDSDTYVSRNTLVENKYNSCKVDERSWQKIQILKDSVEENTFQLDSCKKFFSCQILARKTSNQEQLFCQKNY